MPWHLACLSAAALGASLLVLAQEPTPAEPDLFEASAATGPKFELVELSFSPEAVPEFLKMEVRDGVTVLEGDIVIGEADNPDKGLTDTGIKIWKGAKVPYILPSDFPNRSKVVEGINGYKNTKIQFVEIQQANGDCIQFTTTTNPNVGGQSHLGRLGKGKAQELWMNQNTAKWNVGTVIHELAHALGLMHEQCRGDRDEYVEIIKANINPDYLSQFAQRSTYKDLQGYDFDSILHYPATAFAVTPGLVTIKPRPKYAGQKFGQRQKLSDTDIKSLHELYAREINERDGN